MKSVILSRCPTAQIIDLTHSVPPQDVLAGALLLDDAEPYLPQGSVCIGVVDPGVGSARAALALRTPRTVFLAPDNGLLSPLLHRLRAAGTATELRTLQNPELFLPEVSATFHGRDVFASAAGHLAAGAPFESCGPVRSEHTELPLPEPLERDGGLELHVLRADHFGNLVTDLTRARFQAWNPGGPRVTLRVGSEAVSGVARTYSDVPHGTLLAYFGSSGRLEVGVNGGSAVLRCGPKPALMLYRGPA